jgi:uncharacterized protein (DUF2164 family)
VILVKEATMIAITKDVKVQSLASIKRYFTENMEEEIGDLRAMLLLEFFVSEIGPSIYNQAIADAQVFLQEKIADLEGSCYEPEFSFWQSH